MAYYLKAGAAGSRIYINPPETAESATDSRSGAALRRTSQPPGYPSTAQTLAPSKPGLLCFAIIAMTLRHHRNVPFREGSSPIRELAVRPRGVAAIRWCTCVSNSGCAVRAPKGINMGAVSNVNEHVELNKQAAPEEQAADDLVELGAVSETTKGGLLGDALDASGSDYYIK